MPDFSYGLLPVCFKLFLSDQGWFCLDLIAPFNDLRIPTKSEIYVKKG